MWFEIKLFKSIYARMFLVLCAAAIPTFIGLFFYVYQQRTHLTDLSQKSAQSYVDLLAQHENWLFNSAHDTFNAIAATPLIQTSNWALCHQYLADLIKKQKMYTDIGVIDLQGEPLCFGTLHNISVMPDLADRSYFQRALNQPGLVIGDFQIGRISRSPMIAVATALNDKDNKPRAVLYAALDLSEMFKARNGAQLADGSSTMILDRKGVILNTFPVDLGLAGKKLQDQQILQLISQTPRGSSVIRHTDGVELFVSHTRTGTDEDPQALTVIYQHPTEFLLANVNHSFWIGGAITFLLVMMALALGWAGTQAIVGRNIRYLTEAAHRLRRREFDTRIGGKVTGLEFTEIALQLDQMTHELSIRERQWEMSSQRQKGQNQVLQLIAQNHPLDETLDALVHFAQEQIDDTLASITLLAPDSNRIGSCFAPELPAAYKEALIGSAIGPRTGCCGTAMYEKRIVMAHDIKKDPNWIKRQAMASSLGLRACWAHPILSPEGRVLGAFSLYCLAPRSPKHDELQLSQMASELAAVAIEQQRQSEALLYQTRHDALTGLFNRSVLSTRIKHTVINAREKSSRFYILVMDLDGFKEVNDSLGHQFGDLLLKEVSKRLQSLSSVDATIARTGGDEFAILINETDPAFSIRLIVENLLYHIKQPMLLNGIQIQISASIGIVQYPAHGTKISVLMRHADTAMYQAKREGIGYAFYDWTKDQHTPNRLMLMTHLRHSLEERQFILHYQPKISLRDQGIIGFEALVRWQNPDRGLLYPADFISIIELSELIHPFTLWLVENAAAQCKQWHEQGYQVTMAVNVSARNLLDLSFPAKIQEILTRHDLAAEFLELEITESSIMGDPTRSLDVLTRLHDIGVGIAIDDFGTGYSSLAYLQKLPVDNLKIDRSFVSAMNRQEETLSIVSSIIGLAHNLKVTVTAEGIESRQSLAKLVELGCDYAQGFYIGRPMASDKATVWLQHTVLTKTAGGRQSEIVSRT